MTFKDLQATIEKGIAGDNVGIPIILPKLNNAMNGLQKQTYHLIGGNTGSGKTALVDYIYVLKVFDWLEANPTSDIKVKWIYRSMERNKVYKLAKWTCIKLYERYNILIDVAELLSWKQSDKPIKYKTEIDSLKPYFDKLLQSVEIIDGTDNPTGIYNHVITYAKNNGETTTEGFHTIYKENNPNLITFIILDHIGKLRLERGFSKKENIDKMSQYCNIFRDLYKFNPIVISQFNRAIGDIQRFKLRELTPQIEDFKDSGDTQEDADVILALFSPARYKLFDHMGYDIPKFIKAGKNRFRTITILKNSYGLDDVRTANYFLGECGIYDELPPSENFKTNTNLYNNYL